MKLFITLLFFPFVCWCQIEAATLVDGDKPVIVHINKGVKYYILLLEFSDTVTRKEILIKPNAAELKEFVNDTDSRITYSLGWQPYAGPVWTHKFLNKDLHASYTAGSWASFTFTGRRIELISEKCDNHNSFKIDIYKDGVLFDTKTADLYLSTGGTSSDPCPAGVVQSVYLSPLLPLGTYTVRVEMGAIDLTKVPARNSSIIDGFRVYE